MAPPLPTPGSCPARPLPAMPDILRAATAMAVLTEVWLYLSGSHRSWLRQAEALQELDDRLRRDLGLPHRAPPPLDPWPGHGW